MAIETFQLQGSAATLYEQQKVPAMFGPLADATLQAVPLFEKEKVIDIACGTGIVARKIREKLGADIRIVGVDLNQGMIDIAQALPDAHAQNCEWHVADVTNLPFVDQSFSVAFCQQGLQFFPDTAGALREIHRVLIPNGRLAFSIWAEPSDFFLAVASALRRHVGDETAKRALSPFSFNEVDSLIEHALAVGFKQISHQLLTVDRLIGDPETGIEKELLGTPFGSEIAAKGGATLRKIVDDVADAMTGFMNGPDLVVPQTARLIQASAG